MYICDDLKDKNKKKKTRGKTKRFKKAASQTRDRDSRCIKNNFRKNNERNAAAIHFFVPPRARKLDDFLYCTFRLNKRPEKKSLELRLSLVRKLFKKLGVVVEVLALQ